MRAKELRERTDQELLEMLETEKSELFTNRIKNATHQLDNTDSLRKSKREIARIKTVLTERANAGAAKETVE